MASKCVVAVERVHRLAQPRTGPIQSYPIAPDQTGGLLTEIEVNPGEPIANARFSVAIWMKNFGHSPWDEFNMSALVRRVPQRAGEREEWYTKDDRPVRGQAIPGMTAALMYLRNDWQVNDPGLYELVVTIQRENAADLPVTKRFVVR